MQGTYGYVYRSNNEAVKQSNVYDCILREIFLSRRFKSPHVIRINAIGITNKSEIETRMMWYTGGDLFQIGDKISLAQRELCIEHVAKALDHIHARGVIHCDIKPSNILYDSKTNTFCLADFGISKFAETGPLSQTIVTYPYRAPEINTSGECKKYSFHVDIWAFGCVIYRLFMGRDIIKHQNNIPCTLPKLLEYFSVSEAAFYLLEHQDIYARMHADWIHDHKYLHIIADCLAPTPEKRIKSGEILKKHLNIEPICDAAKMPIVKSMQKYDEHTVVSGLSSKDVNKSDILPRCTMLVLNYSERIYRMIKQPTALTAYVCIYIGAALFLSDNDLVLIQMMEVMGKTSDLGTEICKVLREIKSRL